MKSESGITLLELMAGISLFGLVALSAATIHLSAEKMLVIENAQSRLGLECSYALERIAKDILVSFGDPANPAFVIANAGSELQLRREDLGTQGADANDRWVAYKLVGNQIQYNNNFSTGAWEKVIDNVVTGNPIFQEIDVNNDTVLNDNLIRLAITCRQDPAQPFLATSNPEVALVSAVHILSVASQE